MRLGRIVEIHRPGAGDHGPAAGEHSCRQSVVLDESVQAGLRRGEHEDGGGSNHRRHASVFDGNRQRMEAGSKMQGRLHQGRRIGRTGFEQVRLLGSAAVHIPDDRQGLCAGLPDLRGHADGRPGRRLGLDDKGIREIQRGRFFNAPLDHAADRSSAAGGKQSADIQAAIRRGQRKYVAAADPVADSGAQGPPGRPIPQGDALGGFSAGRYEPAADAQFVSIKRQRVDSGAESVGRAVAQARPDPVLSGGVPANLGDVVGRDASGISELAADVERVVRPHQQRIDFIALDSRPHRFPAGAIPSREIGRDAVGRLHAEASAGVDAAGRIHGNGAYGAIGSACCGIVADVVNALAHVLPVRPVPFYDATGVGHIRVLRSAHIQRLAPAKQSPDVDRVGNSAYRPDVARRRLDLKVPLLPTVSIPPGRRIGRAIRWIA